MFKINLITKFNYSRTNLGHSFLKYSTCYTSDIKKIKSNYDIVIIGCG